MKIPLPLRLDSASNMRQHWRAKAEKTKTQRGIAAAALATAPDWMRDKERVVFVRLTRIAPRVLDRGNIERAFKAVQDGVADALQRDDRDPRLCWRYHQRTGAPKEYGIEIELTATLQEQRCECGMVAGVDLVHWQPTSEKELCPVCVEHRKKYGRR